MEYTNNIFPQDLDAKTAILAILLLIFSVGLYHSLFCTLLKKYMQRLFFSTKHFQSYTDRSFIYLFLISSPMIILSLISLFFNQSFVGIQTSMSLDQLNILIVAGYICWIQQSRHTPIRGMHLIRDIIFALFILGLFLNIYITGEITLDFPIVIIALFVLYYFTVAYFERIQDFFTKVLRLKQSNDYNAKFLLTSKHQTPDFLQIKDLISQKQDLIKEQLLDYHEILANLQQNEEDQQILMNFAKLFLPIKRACQIKEQMDNQQVLKEIQETWQEGSIDSDQQVQNDQQHMAKSPTWNESVDGLGFYLKNTYTDDFVNQQDGEKQLSLYENILKYAFYPIHFASMAEGRLFYLVGYISLILLIGSMFGISNSAAYLSYQMDNLGAISILISLSLVYPSTKYSIEISSSNDYDFSNIFIQCMILKVAIINVFLIVYSLVYTTTLPINNGAFICLIIRMTLFVVYSVFMAMHRFATKSNNFKYFCGFQILASIAQIVLENVYNSNT